VCWPKQVARFKLGAHRPLRGILLRTGAILAVTVFFNAVAGVFGLPLAILSTFLGVIYAVISVIVTSRRDERASQ
jgi:hypothetical protein